MLTITIFYITKVELIFQNNKEPFLLSISIYFLIISRAFLIKVDKNNVTIIIINYYYISKELAFLILLGSLEVFANNNRKIGAINNFIVILEIKGEF